MTRRTELRRDLVRRVRGLSVATTDPGTEGQRDRTSLEQLLDLHLYAVARLWASGTGAAHRHHLMAETTTSRRYVPVGLVAVPVPLPSRADLEREAAS